MDAHAFIRHFPKLYHLSFAENLIGIQDHGLRSLRNLAELHSFSAEERQTSLDTRRRCIQHMHGVTIRDQHAASESKMRSCLVRITIPEWLALLNAKVFFYPSREKARELIKRYTHYENVLLEIDSALLLATCANNITLCRINSGAFLQNPRTRGRDSFIPLAAYLYKNKRDTPAEVTVDVPIPNILRMATVVPI